MESNYQEIVMECGKKIRIPQLGERKNDGSRKAKGREESIPKAGMESNKWIRKQSQNEKRN